MTADTETPSPGQGNDSLAFGGFLVVLAVLILVFARDIDSQDRGNHDPGPQAVPLSLGVLLLAGGFYQLVAGWWSRRRMARDEAPMRLDEEPAQAAPPQSWNVLITVLALAGYISLLSVLGFSLATVLLAWGLIWRFGSSWWGALFVAVLLSFTVKLMFSVLFHVPLPDGLLGLPF